MRSHPVLDALEMTGVKLGIDRMREFLAAMGDPHRRYPVVHVGGTNGKGSVCRMVGAMLEAEGHRVGITTSPHLQHLNERFRIGARPVADGVLDAALREVARARDTWAPGGLTWFELSIAAAFHLFAEAEVDVAVVEVGMGGRLDATNVVDPAVAAVVSVGLDHTAELGPDVVSIAREKAGILKGGPAVIGPVPPEALEVLRVEGASIHGEDFVAEGGVADFRFRGALGRLEGLALGLEGAHQVANAAVALETIGRLPLRVSERAIRSGLRDVRNRGRLEWLASDLLVDGAHNPDGARVLAGFVATLPRPRTLLLGAGADKDVRGVYEALAAGFDRVVATASSHPRARPSGQLAAELGVEDGGPLADALVRARDGSLVVVAGSLFLVGAVRDLLGID